MRRIPIAAVHRQAEIADTEKTDVRTDITQIRIETDRNVALIPGVMSTKACAEAKVIGVVADKKGRSHDRLF